MHDVHGNTATLLAINKISPQLQLLARYQHNVNELATTQTTAPREWQHWLWISFGCVIFFIPFVFVMKGRWSPRRARQDQREHNEFVAAELANVRHEMSSVGWRGRRGRPRGRRGRPRGLFGPPNVANQDEPSLVGGRLPASQPGQVLEARGILPGGRWYPWWGQANSLLCAPYLAKPVRS